jgi:uncharacterized protein YjlB
LIFSVFILQYQPIMVKTYHLPPTALIPNSPQPLVHYPRILSEDTLSAEKVHDLFSRNGWQTQWIFRYGPTQTSHYHSAAHECMAVLSGTATIRFGVADTVADLNESTYGSGKEEGGVELQARAGDVFVIPAGVAHKTFDTSYGSTFKLLTPGDGHLIQAEDVSTALAGIELSGFTMIGAYPVGCVWDFAEGGHDVGAFERVWSVPKPDKDPVLGQAPEGLYALWK